MVARGRRRHGRALDVWANGQLIAQWRIPARGPMELQYEPSWVVCAEARPLSLSLPMNLDNRPLKGERVEFYFDNLLPDSEPIRRRLQAKFRTHSRKAFDLLEAIGRDCVGAIQLLPEGQAPHDVFRIDVEPLDEVGVEHMLTAAVTAASGLGPGLDDEDAFSDFDCWCARKDGAHLARRPLVQAARCHSDHAHFQTPAGTRGSPERGHANVGRKRVAVCTAAGRVRTAYRVARGGTLGRAEGAHRGAL